MGKFHGYVSLPEGSRQKIQQQKKSETKSERDRSAKFCTKTFLLTSIKIILGVPRSNSTKNGLKAVSGSTWGPLIRET